MCQQSEASIIDKIIGNARKRNFLSVPKLECFWLFKIADLFDVNRNIEALTNRIFCASNAQNDVKQKNLTRFEASKRVKFLFCFRSSETLFG